MGAGAGAGAAANAGSGVGVGAGTAGAGGAGGTGTGLGWERNTVVAKEAMAIDAREGFGRGAAAWEGCASVGAWIACIFSCYFPAIDMACTNGERTGCVVEESPVRLVDRRME